MTSKVKIYKFLRREIVNGHLNPGERIIETEISAKTGFSRGPIREAMTRFRRLRLRSLKIGIRYWRS